MYHLGIKRVIDLRHHETDQNKAIWLDRYDDQGRPVCPCGYHLVANGFDAARHRHKWCCNHCTGR